MATESGTHKTDRVFGVIQIPAWNPETPLRFYTIRKTPQNFASIYNIAMLRVLQESEATVVERVRYDRFLSPYHKRPMLVAETVPLCFGTSKVAS